MTYPKATPSGAPQLTLRPAQPADVSLILQFIQELADYEKLRHEAVATEALLNLHLFGPEPSAEVVLAEWDQRAAGLALYFRTFSTFLSLPGIYLEDLYVRPNFRGRGVGRSLLEYLAQQVVTRGYGRLEWSVLNWNNPAIGFYESLGAEPLSGWTGYRLTGDALEKLAHRPSR
ncbi:MAG: GNAT family N-acetyltransferase [Elainellaceae cyanobacterium]